jgi:hypothetical protein
VFLVGGSASNNPGAPPSPGSGQRHGQQVHGHKHLGKLTGSALSLAVLLLIDVCTGTNRDYWVNMRSYVSQWTRPYLRKNFRNQDLEVETFVTVLVLNDVFPKRYAVLLLHHCTSLTG